jgi:hypothetical protein
MHTWEIYQEDEESGKRTLLGIIQATSMSEALSLASQYYERDSGELVAVLDRKGAMMHDAKN